MRKPPPPPQTKGAPAVRFRTQIEAALAEGAAADELTLKLTLRDASLLTRDPHTAISDISYSDGVMRYLGVKVEQGGVSASALVRGEG